MDLAIPCSIMTTTRQGASPTTSLQFAWHVHHDVLVEVLVAPIEERQQYIREHKPYDEVDLRLRLLRVVDGDVLPKGYAEAGRAYNVAWRTYDETGRASNVACRAYDETGRAYDVAQRAYDVAWNAYDVARRIHTPELERIHRLQCAPNCPWDGYTIFPAR